jgi:hypothetical protein
MQVVTMLMHLVLTIFWIGILAYLWAERQSSHQAHGQLRLSWLCDECQ